MTLVLSNGLVTTAAQSRRAGVRVVDGHIAEIGDIAPDPGDDVIDCTGCLVLPGGIDSHTHLDLESMGTVTADDFASGSRSALAGGTTTLLDFATAFHGESLADGLRRWHAKADGRAVCDYGFHLAMTQWRPELGEEMGAMVDAGVTSFKMYMAYRHTMMVEDDEIYAALSASAALGCTIGFHCENGRIVDALVQRQISAGHTSAYYHHLTRPPALETEALARLGMIAGLLDAPHYVVHLSAAASVEELRAARRRGSRIVAETCPQYLVLDSGAYGTPGDDLEARAYVMSPPLRSSADADALWDGLAAGDVQFVGTDHCSFDLHGQKDRADDFTEVPNGVPGVELRLPLLYSFGVARGRLTLQRFVAVTAENAARYFGLYPRKGALLPGSDADIVVYDPTPEWTVYHGDLHDHVDHTPYEGLVIQGRVREVFLGGRPVMRRGRLLPDLPPGTFVACGLPDNAVR